MKTFTAVFLAGLSWMWAGCQTVPLEQKYTAAQLRTLIDEPMPLCVKEQCEIENGAIRCWLYEPYMGKFVQPEECLEEFHSWERRIADRRAALDRRYTRDAATTPSCIRQRTVSRALFEIVEVDPDATDAVSQALARGAFVPFEDPQCTAEVCQWRLRVEPSEHSSYCEMAARNLVTGHGPETPSD